MHDPEARVLPTSYSYDGLNGLSLAIANQGTRTARLADQASLYLLLDADDTPLWFHFLTTPASPGDLLLPPQGSATLSDPYVAYNGAASRIAVFFDFADQ